MTDAPAQSAESQVTVPVRMHRVLVDLFLAGVAIQFFLAGLGVFRAKSHGTQRLADSTTFDPHRALGTALVVVALLILIVAVIAATQVVESVALLVLMILQIVWTTIGSSAPAAAALHVLGGFVITLLAYTMHRAGRAPIASAATAV